MAKLAQRIGDKRVLKLIRRFLQAGGMENGRVSPVDEGTPQGGPLSPMLSNVVLDPTDIRTAIYTTNSVESLNRSLRKIIKIRGGFPNEEAALKLLFLALRQAAKKWTMPIHHWREALNHFTILWPERMPALERVA